MRKTLIALLLIPAAALAQAAPKDKAGPGGTEEGRPDPARIEKRMRMARTLGLAEALDLDTAQALKLGDALSKFDDRRQAARKQAVDAREALRKAAQPDSKATAAEVDGAIGKLLDSRAQLQAVDKDMLASVSKDLSPQQRARAALFLGRFRERIERHVMPFGPGMGHAGMGPHGPGMQHGAHGMMVGPRGGPDGGMGMMGGKGMEGCPADCPMMHHGEKGGPTGARMPMGEDRLSAWSGGAPDGASFDPPPFADEEED
jgi:Spy/CpxP family protein refolding chaperone